MKKVYIIAARVLLFVLFAYASTAKLIDFSLFNVQLKQSPLIPIDLTAILACVVPGFEIVIVFMLFFNRTAYYGLLLSFFLMLLFSLYLIILVLFFQRVPCSCGGILGHMGYPVHILFNLVMTAIALIATLYYSSSNEAEVNS